MNYIRINSTNDSSRTFIATGAALFAASAALTIAWCNSMSAMHDMPMPGGWSMSMMWMRMPGQSWPGSAAEFLGMWLVMMLAMMLPSVLPVLWRHRQLAGAANASYPAWLAVQMGGGYFSVWMLFGAIAFFAGTTLAALEMQLPWLARAVPAAIGATVTLAGGLQFSAWKAHRLACCRALPTCCDALAIDARAAWRSGMRLGMHCVHCCFGMTLVLLVIGVMDLRAMAVVTAAISAERLAPAGQRVARFTGAAMLAAGVVMTARAVIA